MQRVRAYSKSISRMLIGMLLFAQFAVASYACPGLKGMASSANQSMATAMVAAAADESPAAQPEIMPPGCDQMDPNAANLCAEHCHQGQQSADTAAVPAVGPGIPTFLYALSLEPQHLLGSGRSLPSPDASLDAATEPPHAILHCVFRI